MSLGKPVFNELVLYVFRKGENSYLIRNSRLFFVDLLGYFYLRETKILHQFFVRSGFFQKVQIFSLNVFDKWDESSFLILHRFDYGSYLWQTRHLRGSEPPLSCYYRIAGAIVFKYYRLQHSIFLYRTAQFLDSLIIEDLPRLLGICQYFTYRNGYYLLQNRTFLLPGLYFLLHPHKPQYSSFFLFHHRSSSHGKIITFPGQEKTLFFTQKIP